MPIVRIEDSPDVLAVVPTMATDLDRLRRCVSSLAATAGPLRVGILCVINSSTIAPFTLEGATVESAGLNWGWGGGLQFGASLADSAMIWFIQDDMTVRPDTLNHLHSALLSDSTLGAVSPVMIGDDGRVPPGSCGGFVSSDGALTGWYPTEPCAVEALDDLGQLSYVPSRGLLVRRAAYADAGGPNARLYPVQFVDVDFCFRLTSLGWGFRMIPTAAVAHESQGSTPTRFAQFLHSRNIDTFRQDWFPGTPNPPARFIDTAAKRPDPVTAPRRHVHRSVSGTLVEAVAQSAADTLTHAARVFAALLDSEAARSQAQREADSRRAEAAEADNAALRARIESLEASRSWRITAPLRWLASRVRR